ncbi:MAG: hypothetical protein ACRDQA_05945 [Nocardioidaceae bacterium]
MKTDGERHAVLNEESQAWIMQYNDLERRRREIVEVQEQIKDKIRSTLPPGRTETPAGTVSIIESRRFATAKAIDLYGHERLAEAIEERISATKAKQILTGQEYEAAMETAGQPKVLFS